MITALLTCTLLLWTFIEKVRFDFSDVMTGEGELMRSRSKTLGLVEHLGVNYGNGGQLGGEDKLTRLSHL